MSTKSNLATLAPPAPPLQVYIPAAGLVISPPAAREADDRARAVASPKDLREIRRLLATPKAANKRGGRS